MDSSIQPPRIPGWQSSTQRHVSTLCSSPTVRDIFTGQVGASGSDWNAKPLGYALTQLAQPAAPAGPASRLAEFGNNGAYESYLFSPAVNTTSTPTPNVLAQLDGTWVNDNGTKSANAIWAFFADANYLFLINDLDSFLAIYGGPTQAATLYLIP